MIVEEQRKLGTKLAIQLGIEKTLDIIKNTNSGYAEIFTSAAAELGADKLASIVLEQDEPSWALAVLRHVPGIDKHRDALLAKSTPLQKAIRSAGAAVAETTLGRIAAFELDVEVGASYSAYFTMYWQIGPNVTEPAAGYAPNSAPMKWSYEVLVGQATQNLCKYFALPQAPLGVGDTVWMVVDVCGGGWYETPYKFTYDPGGDTAMILASGGTLTAQFNWQMKP